MDFYHRLSKSALLRLLNSSKIKYNDKKYFVKFMFSSTINNNLGTHPFQHFSSPSSTQSTITTTFHVTNCANNNHRQWYDHFLSTNDTDVYQILKSSFMIYENFISVEEEKCLLNEIEPYLKRLRYEHNHWDDAIHAYRETERKHWNKSNKNILNRIKSVAFESAESPLLFTHVLDIEKVGYIKPHIDSIRFCGRTIAGLSLLSPCVMRLALDKDKTKYADLLLLPRSLYIMRDEARFNFTHEVLPEEKSEFKGNAVPRDRRISIIQRLKPENE